MGEETKIEWCDHTFNPFIGCTKVSPGCDNCYAEAMMDKRYGRVKWGPHGERVRTSEANWKQPLRWANKARAAQEAWERAPIFGRSRERPHRPRVFCASLADVFDNQVPREWRLDLWTLIYKTPELDWLLLTKRPENIIKMLPAFGWPWTNVWLGFTAEDQPHFDRRWKIMREIPAAVRFCSYEPALGPLRLFKQENGYDFAKGLNWLICGGESGTGYRHMDLRWEQDIRLDCLRNGTSYFLKQFAGKRPIPADFPLVRELPKTA